ncbi:MAG: hypothetical protein K2X87_29630 [Gemmataceae bacterium]|nr:hypothetical protein [Gemmataceae bacterium]
MLATLVKHARLLTAALLLGVWAGPAEAGWWNRSKPEPTDKVTATRTRDDADPAVGVAVIAAGLALFVFLAWVAVRVGGSGGVPANDLPE